MKMFLKHAVCYGFMVLLFPAALLSGFGRVKSIYTIFAHSCALLPGAVGDYCRTAYYVLTLRDCSIDARIRFGSYLPHRAATLAAGVDIGAYCIVGCVVIGERTMIASHVHVLSGSRQHRRDEQGQLLTGTVLQEINIGADCWIGAGAIIMADVGAGSNIGAGSVVGAPVAPGSVVMGNPARTVKTVVPAS